MTVYYGATLLTPAGPVADGWVDIDAGVVVDVGGGDPSRRGRSRTGPARALRGWLAPGFVELHMHGGGGHDVTVSPAAMAAAVGFHRDHGTAATLISLMAAPPDALCQQLAWVADLAATPGSGVLGAHLEGPFLAHSRCGAQNPSHMITPDLAVVDALVGAGRGHLRAMTVAPELPGALEVIDLLVASGVVAAVGHTDATYDQARAAFERGATLATHLYNAMRPVHHREPGPVVAALEAGAVCEIINDGHHVHPAIVRQVASHPRARMALVTDAIDAAGMPDGTYRLAGQAAEVRAGVARLAPGGALAGSTLTLDAAVGRAVAAGVSLPDAVAAATATPAAALGVGDRCGALRPGAPADLVLLDDDGTRRAVMHGGQWTAEGGEPDARQAQHS